MGLSPAVAGIVCGWVVLLATWFVATLMAARLSDNRTRPNTPVAHLAPSFTEEEGVLQ